jgi:hypothetical protein
VVLLESVVVVCDDVLLMVELVALIVVEPVPVNDRVLVSVVLLAVTVLTCEVEVPVELLVELV